MNIKDIFNNMDYGKAPESPDTALDWLAQHNNKFGHFIGGEWVKGPSRKGGHFDSNNPATGKALAKVAQADKKTVDKAVQAAAEAQSKWQATSGHERAQYLYAIARLLQKNARLFAVLETLDNGKPIRESRDIDVPLAVRHFYHHAGWAQLLDTEMPDHQAIGVVGQVIPWNFPLLMLAWKIAPAIATGNTVVIKPAEFTSLTALLFAEICQQAGLPKGVVNVVTGDGKTGQLIVEHPGIKKIAFTGSTAVGRWIRQATAGSGKKLSLELGGKSAFIVCNDADLDAAVEGVVDAIWFNQGQVCCAGSRLLVQEAVADRFHKKLIARMHKLRIGDPLDKSIDMGAIIDPRQQQKIATLVQAGVDAGACLNQSDAKLPKNGCFYPPTLLTDVSPSDQVVQDEIFGPVLVSMTFRTPDEAVALANNSRYGLAASIWSENINMAMHLAPLVQAGVVWINCTNQFDAAAGFGGVKESGFGREGGKEGLYEYLQDKTANSKKMTTKAKTKAKLTPVEGMDKTPKMYIGGKQTRPDGGYTYPVHDHRGDIITHVGLGNRKDIRNAVEAAASSKAWSQMNAYQRQQVMYFMAENLSYRAAEFSARLQAFGHSKKQAELEVESSIQRINYYAAWCDKYDGQVHGVPMRGVAMAMHEPIGVIGIQCPDDAPLLSFISLLAPAMAMGNRVVMTASETYPLPALDFYQVLNTSDVPAGTVNIISGEQAELVKPLAGHMNVDAVWHFGDLAETVEHESATNLKRTWTETTVRDWMKQGQGQNFLRQATQVKNIWTPYGE
ncbi:aldehyde dehydrogenase family protein [Marinicella sp. S1101]|uniref:aldehyde dehydrogenase family protein n=1 Tax=Marinicella marina TaxID=2996016 RepID=UPI00226093F0|nr:aldehyde dehydrogenase family protein [Marinicella marina]MCX7552830.1 aldehyde dehydrogenase family protein [Marinicella marina]MDJ1139861.1 aldehyde dehydrogenase family protein [Marinicella marina]